MVEGRAGADPVFDLRQLNIDSLREQESESITLIALSLIYPSMQVNRVYRSISRPTVAYIVGSPV